MRYFIGFLVTIGLIVLVFVLILRGSGSNGPLPQSVNLGDYSNTNAVAQLIIDGPITADQTHREVQLDISANQASIDIFQGYQQSVLNSKSYVNNGTAFSVFLHALQQANFTKGDSSKALSDERGICPAGDRYIFSFTNDSGKQLLRYWTTTCGGGTFKGNLATTLYLFKRQIPDYDTLTSNVAVF